MKYTIKLHNNNFTINDHIINDKIFDEELHDYKIADREDLIDHLTIWITENDNANDKKLMLEDLKYLLIQKDKFIFSSISTNNYVLESVETESFNKIAGELLDLSLNIQTN